MYKVTDKVSLDVSVSSAVSYEAEGLVVVTSMETGTDYQEFVTPINLAAVIGRMVDNGLPVSDLVDLHNQLSLATNLIECIIEESV